MDYGDWSIEFWQWLYSMPTDAHPLFDTADCSEGQSGNVWFLGGTFSTVPVNPTTVIGEADRECTVPPGTALYFPLINAACSNLEGDGETDEELRACANFLADHMGDLVAVVDGAPLGNLETYRAESDLFEFGPLPEGNVLGQDEGTTGIAVADGIAVMLAPLSAGEHTVEFSGAAVFTAEDDGFDFTFILDIGYTIYVEP